MSALRPAARVAFGAWMLANGANHLFLGLWPEPVGHTPLASQLMNALLHSGLYDIAMVIELVAGALVLLGRFTPAALCLLMPVSTCALYWALILDHQPLAMLLALAAFALNGWLMLGHLPFYRGVLQRRASAYGEP